MLKKLFAVILVAFFVFGGSAQPALALDPNVPPCTLQIKSSNDATYSTGGVVTLYKGESLDVKLDRLIELASLGSAYTNDAYYVRGRVGPNGQFTSSFYVLNGEINNGVATLNLSESELRATAGNGAATHFYVYLDPSVGSGSPNHEVYCVAQSSVKYENESRNREMCNVDAVVTKNDSGTEYYIGFSSSMTNFQNPGGYRIGLWHGGFNPINIPRPYMPIPSNFFSQNSLGLYDGTITSANAPNRALWTIPASQVNVVDGGTLAVNGPEPSYDREICSAVIDFKNAKTGLPPVIEIPDVTGASIAEFTLCGQLSGDQKAACEACSFQGTSGDVTKPTHIYSAIGCIPVDEKGFLRQMIQVLLSVSGMIALLSILAGAFLLSTSQGDANQVKKAKELITAAVSGLLFIIFSTIILDFIGVQILRIPGLS
jgi:hypothetical protein